MSKVVPLAVYSPLVVLSPMDSPACLACGERAITWDSEANHAVCTSCGNADTNPMLVVGQFVRPQDTLLHRPYISNNFPDNPYINQNLLQGAEWHLQNHLVSALHA